MSDTSNQRRKLSMAELARLSKDLAQKAERYPLYLVLDDVRSMYNVGSIFRTADAFRVSKIWLCGYTPVPPHREIEKTALGATETVPWEKAEDIDSLIRNLKNEKLNIYAVEQTTNSRSLDQMNELLQLPAVFIFGNEVYGIKQSVIDLCDDVLEIPQFGHKHSFNVAVTAGMVMWEWFKFFKTKYGYMNE
jgi:tRNA G18 (ribose-2'-O)-methylase SpoU